MTNKEKVAEIEDMLNTLYDGYEECEDFVWMTPDERRELEEKYYECIKYLKSFLANDK